MKKGSAVAEPFRFDRVRLSAVAGLVTSVAEILPAAIRPGPQRSRRLHHEHGRAPHRTVVAVVLLAVMAIVPVAMCGAGLRVCGRQNQRRGEGSDGEADHGISLREPVKETPAGPQGSKYRSAICLLSAKINSRRGDPCRTLALTKRRAAGTTLWRTAA